MNHCTISRPTGGVVSGPLGFNKSKDGEVMILAAPTNREQNHSPWKLNTAVTAKQSFVKGVTLPWYFTAHFGGVIVLSKALRIKYNSLQSIPAAACRQLVANRAEALGFHWISISEQQVGVITTSHFLTSSLSQLPHALSVIILVYYNGSKNRVLRKECHWDN